MNTIFLSTLLYLTPNEQLGKDDHPRAITHSAVHLSLEEAIAFLRSYCDPDEFDYHQDIIRETFKTKSRYEGNDAINQQWFVIKKCTASNNAEVAIEHTWYNR